MIGSIHCYPVELTTEQKSDKKLLLCDGSYYSHITYSDLFDIVGYTFGQSGSNPTYNFRVPDYRSVFLRGLDLSRDIDDDRVIEFDYQAGSNFSHNHSGSTGSGGIHNHALDLYRGTGETAGHVEMGDDNLYGVAGTGNSSSHTHTISSSGDTVGKPDNCAVCYYIQYEEVTVSQEVIDQIQYIYDEISGLLSYIQTP